MRYVMDFEQIDSTDLAAVGGKGVHLGELSRIDGIRVPEGFCVTTDAFQRVVAGVPSIEARLDLLSRGNPDDHAEIRTVSTEIRNLIEGAAVPDDLEAAIGESLARLGEEGSYAVRSSATAEDMPTASFAGQQDSYLNVVGLAAIIRHVRRCWASLFTERAVIYRSRNGFDHRKVRMAVVVQRMVFPDAAGILFTADPVTSNRKIATVEAAWGLAESLVSGLVSGDVYTVRDDQVVTTTVATKPTSTQASPAGGTQDSPIDPERQIQPALTDAQVVNLVRLGRRIEASFGRPQDIEWCLAGDDFHIVQSRAITTLFPVPPADDAENHVYLSVGHQQMMTDAIRPLGLSLWQLTTPRPMHEAGGRLFVDVTPALATPTGRTGLLETMGKHDLLTRDALQSVLDRGDFLRTLPDEDPGAAPAPESPEPIETDPAIVTRLIRNSQDSITTLQGTIRDLTGPALLDFILADIAELKRILFDPESHRVLMAGMEATWWLNDHMEEWLGEKNAADALTQSVPHNVTSEMGLALLDVADTLRPFPGVVAFLQRVVDEGREGDGFLDDLAGLPGGREARDAIRGYLDEYGMRCAGEIDITRTRWSENPALLVPTILGNVKNFEQGAGRRRFEQGSRNHGRRNESS